MKVARRVGGMSIDKTRTRIALDRAAPTESDGPALVVGVVTSDGLVDVGVWGLASLEHHVSASESTVFYVASLSKQFTALCILLAADRGELRLDHPLARWVPELPVWAQTVDLTHLLWHAAGLACGSSPWRIIVMAGGTGFGYRAFSARSSSSDVSVIALSNHMATDVRASAFAVLDAVLRLG